MHITNYEVMCFLQNEIHPMSQEIYILTVAASTLTADEEKKPYLLLPRFCNVDYVHCAFILVLGTLSRKPKALRTSVYL